MAEDLYSDEGDMGSAEKSPSYGGEEPTEAAGSALLPKEFFPTDKPLEPGATCSVKVVRVEDGQVEVEYAHDEEDASAEEAEIPEAAVPAEPEGSYME